MRLRNGNLIFQNKALHEIKFMYNARMRLLILVCKHNNVLYAEEFYRKGLKLYNLEKLIKNGEWIKFTDATLQVFLDSSHPELIQPLYELDKNKVEEFNLNVDKEENIKLLNDIGSNYTFNSSSSTFWNDTTSAILYVNYFQGGISPRIFSINSKIKP